MEISQIILKDLTKWFNSYLASLTRADSIEFYNKSLTGRKIKLGGPMFLKVSDSLPLSIEIKDKFGNMAKVDGAPAWAVTDASLATVEVAADGLSAVLKPVGAVGSFKVQVSADADLGEGVKAILGELDIELLSGEAVAVALVAGQAIPA